MTSAVPTARSFAARSTRSPVLMSAGSAMFSMPLEGKTGNGDSGGPALDQINDQWVLVGLSAWGFIHGDVKATRPGLYGQLTCNVRLSHYIEWIQGVISEPLGA